MTTYDPEHNQQGREVILRNQEYTIDTTDWSTLEQGPKGVRKIAEIEIPGVKENKTFQILDLRGVGPTEEIGGTPCIEYNGAHIVCSENLPFVIEGKSASGETKVRGIRKGWDPIVIGRADEKSAELFGLADYALVSRAHFNIGLDEQGNILVADTSSNGTLVRPIDARSGGGTILETRDDLIRGEGRGDGRFNNGVVPVDQPGPQAIRQAAAMPGSGIVDLGNGRYYQS